MIGLPDEVLFVILKILHFSGNEFFEISSGENKGLLHYLSGSPIKYYSINLLSRHIGQTPWFAISMLN